MALTRQAKRSGGGAQLELETTAAFCCWSFCFLLPFHGIGQAAFSFYGIWIGDFLLLVGGPCWLLLAWMARRRLTQSLVLWLLVGWSASLLIALVAHGRFGDIKSWLAPVQLLVTIVGVAVVADLRGKPFIAGGIVAGGVVSLAVGLAGYVVRLTGLVSWDAFALFHPHPILAGLPRFTGTYGRSPQHAGEVLVLVLAATLYLWHERRPRWAPVVVVASIVGILLTLSFAWIGAMVLLAATWAATRSRPKKMIAAAVVALAAAGLVWLMHFGLPRAVPPGPVDCARVDGEHSVVQHGLAGGACRQAAQSWPYEAPLTLYRHGKEVAVDLLSRHPLLGVGPGAFADFARRDAALRFPEPTSSGASAYGTAHSTPLTAHLEGGLLGALVVWALGLLLIRNALRNPTGAGIFWVAALAFVVIGVSVDLLRLRHVFVLFGLVATIEMNGTRRPEA